MAYRVYLLDDDRFLLDLYATKFRGAGHDVTVFSTGQDLLETLKKGGPEGNPQAILLDLIMPGMTGFEVVDEIRKEELAKDTKIIVLSNQGQESDIERAKALKADGYIIKASATPSEVLAETVKIIESSKPL